MGYTTAYMRKLIANLQQKIVDSDPGLIKFRLGLKSVLALLISLSIITTWMPAIGIVYASLVSVFAGLTHVGETLQEQKRSMLLAVAYFAVAIGLGLFLQSYFYLANSLLIVLSFLAFYLGKFGARYRNYPVVGAIFYLLSINLMVPDLHEKLLIVSGVLIAGSVMFVVHFYLWPKSPKAELSQHIELLFNRYIACVGLMEKGLSVDLKNSRNHYKETQSLFAELEQRLNAESQLIGQPYMKQQKECLETLLVKQYALYSLLKMMASWLEQLKSQHELTQQSQQLIMSILAQLLKSLIRLKQLCHASIEGPLIDKEFVDATEQFKQSVFSKHGMAGPALVYYSYLAFSFSRSIALMEFIQNLIQELELS
ncbi:MAG: hypothetical protein K0R66_724 [Gammaproteobacteria bacterium]|jgi:hypothetical protein|nr:hypothetical protein [Gammaproteobacteria bacterium]